MIMTFGHYQRGVKFVLVFIGWKTVSHYDSLVPPFPCFLFEAFLYFHCFVKHQLSEITLLHCFGCILFFLIISFCPSWHYVLYQMPLSNNISKCVNHEVPWDIFASMIESSDWQLIITIPLPPFVDPSLFKSQMLVSHSPQLERALFHQCTL